MENQGFMNEHMLQIAIAFPAALFSGIVLFLASVLRRTFENITETEYHALFTQIIHNGRRSILINTIVLFPPVALIVYLARYGFADVLFITGVLVYSVGSFVLSRLWNEPAYSQLLTTPRTDIEATARLRSKLNRSNRARAILSTVGVLLMALALLN